MILLFAAALFLNSALLFFLQPMFAKMILPLLGGAPAVWNTCMVFYQASLLGGYACAHWSSSRLTAKGQVIAHSGLFLLGVLCLPIAVSKGFVPPTHSNPIPWLLALLSASVALPFVALSSNSSMLQNWFSKTGDAEAKDPYFLYQASNLGSMLALVCYPALIEPVFRLSQQSRLWSIAYAAVALLTAACGMKVWKQTTGRPPRANIRENRPAPRPRNRQRLRWIALAFVPSSLMLAVTTYLTTCISPVPLLWVIPLAIYLGTFVIAFGRRPILSAATMVRLQPLLLLPLLFLMMTDAARPAWAILPLHLLVLFATAMVCHGELAESRPAAEHLTEFYLWLAVGGALGGVFNAILGPILFRSIAEYSITLVIACLLRPAAAEPVNWADLGYPALIGAFTLGLSWFSQTRRIDLRPFFALPAIACLALKDRPLRFAAGVGAVLLFSLPYAAELGWPIHVERSFFGVHRVLADRDKKFHWLTHGSIVHGVQSLDPAHKTEPLAYFHRSGPLGQLFASMGDDLHSGPVAVIGLGTGAIACYGRAGQPWTYYEIDPAVERIARDPRYFSYLNDCPSRPSVVLGDARLSLAGVPDGSYHVIILDAFSSDTIPIHLLTREALRLYLAKTDRHGILIFHISNGYLDLKPVIGNLAHDMGLSAFIQEYELDESAKTDGMLSSSWAVLAKNPSALQPLAGNPAWRPAKASGRPWTDDFSNIITLLQWK